MGVPSHPSPQRSRLAYEAARILAEQGDQAFDHARRKAALRIGILNRRDWPTNEEIQGALLEQLRLFAPERVHGDLQHLRTQAVAAMGVFAKFRPRLVGPALSGTGDMHQGVRLHLFADSPEEVVFVLCDRHIPWQEREEPLRFGGGVRRVVPAFAFVAGDIPFTLVVLPIQALSNPPLDTVTDRPERGADLQTVRRLLEGPGASAIADAALRRCPPAGLYPPG
jgi:hypothetical protein